MINRLPIRFSLRARMVLAFLAVAVLPLIILAVIAYQLLSNVVTDTIEQDIINANRQAAFTIENFLENGLTSIHAASNLPHISRFISDPSMGKGEVLSILQSLVSRDSIFISSYGILDNNGKNILDTNPKYIGISEADRPYFRSTIASGRPIVTNVKFYNNFPSFFFSQAIQDNRGQNIGVLRVEYNAAILQWLINNSKPAQQDAYVVLIDNENYLRLAHSTAPELIYRTYANLSEEQAVNLQKAAALPNGSTQKISTYMPGMIEGLQKLAIQPLFSTGAYALDGEPTLTLGTKIVRAPWLVLVRIPTSTIQTDLNRQVGSSVSLTLLIVVLVTLLALAITRWFTRPIVRLTRISEQVAGGNLDIRADESGLDELGILGKTFNSMTRQLKETLEGLEGTVAERTRALELSSDVSRRLSTILDPEKLLSEVVELLQDTFNYYHVHIYLVDSDRQDLILAGATGEAGRIMLGLGHRIETGRGVIGRVAESGTQIHIPDVRRDPDWLPNPLLPETQSELATPIFLSERLIGVLDIQQNKVNGLTNQDVDLMRGIVSQIAIALNNADQYREIQQHSHYVAVTGAIIEQIQKTQTVEDALQVAVRELGRALQQPRTMVRLALELEVEPTARQESREGWETYLEEQAGKKDITFVYDLNEVKTIAANPVCVDTNNQSEKLVRKPLSIRGIPIGELIVEIKTDLVELDAELLHAVSVRLSEHLETLRLTEQTRRALAETEVLYNIIAEINEAENYDDILTALSNGTILAQSSPFRWMGIYDRPLSGLNRPQYAYTLAQKTTTGHQLARRYAINLLEMQPERLFRDTPVVAKDLFVDRRFSRSIETLLPGLSELSSGVVIPLLLGNQAIGFVMAFFAQPMTFSPADLNRLSAVASQAAIAVQSRFLLEQAQSRARQEQLLRQVTSQVINATDVDTIMRRAVEQIGHALGLPSYIYIGNPQTQSPDPEEQS